jgi:hypothetical protein
MEYPHGSPTNWARRFKKMIRMDHSSQKHAEKTTKSKYLCGFFYVGDYENLDLDTLLPMDTIPHMYVIGEVSDTTDQPLGRYGA